MTNEYLDGSYHKGGDRHTEDAVLKLEGVTPLLDMIQVRTVADVGCGSGAITSLLAKRYQVTGYDVSPNVLTISDDQANFVRGDFRAVGEPADLVTMFDVFEHVVDPISFISDCSRKSNYMLFHIPLDNHYFGMLRDQFRTKLNGPGHLIYLDPAAALNVVAFAGLRTVEYIYTPTFKLPSANRTKATRLLNKIRSIGFAISPGLTAKVLGNVSLAVLARTSDATGNITSEQHK